MAPPLSRKAVGAVPGYEVAAVGNSATRPANRCQPIPCEQLSARRLSIGRGVDERDDAKSASPGWPSAPVAPVCALRERSDWPPSSALAAQQCIDGLQAGGINGGPLGELQDSSKNGFHLHGSTALKIL